MKEVFEDSEGRYIEGKKRNTRYYEQHCQHCTDLFFPKRKGQIYCSQSCNVGACRVRNGYELNTKEKQADKISNTELQEIKEKLSKQIVGINVEGLKSVVAGNAIYDAGKSVASWLGFKSKLEKSIEQIDQKLTSVQNQLVKGNIHLPQKSLGQVEALKETGKQVRFFDENGRVVILKEFSTANHFYYRLQKSEGPSRNLLMNL